MIGLEEEFIKPEHTRRLAELIPGAELVLMPGTGHFAPRAQPEEFNRIVLDFLAAQEGTPDTQSGDPIVGAWQWNADPTRPEPSTFAIFHADGTYTEWQPVGGRQSEFGG